MPNILVSGPAGAGKSQVARELLAASLVPTIMLDFQTIYAALLGIERDIESRRYPEREAENAFALALAEYVRRAAITAAAQQDAEVIATNSDGSPERRQFLLGLLGPGAVERVVDPGPQIVIGNLTTTEGVLSSQCRDALRRWYGSGGDLDSFFREFDVVREIRNVEVRQEANDLVATLIQEGTPATGGRREVFTNGSMEWQEGVNILLVHRGKPETRAIPERQADGRITIKTPLTPAIRQAWDAGKRFMSVEFHPIEERTISGIRTFKRALLVAAAMVVKPEYDMATAELRDTAKRRQRRYWL